MLTGRIESLEHELSERNGLLRSSSAQDSQQIRQEISNLRQEKDSLLKQRVELDDKLRQGNLLSPEVRHSKDHIFQCFSLSGISRLSSISSSCKQAFVVVWNKQLYLIYCSSACAPSLRRSEHCSSLMRQSRLSMRLSSIRTRPSLRGRDSWGLQPACSPSGRWTSWPNSVTCLLQRPEHCSASTLTRSVPSEYRCLWWWCRICCPPHVMLIALLGCTLAEECWRGLFLQVVSLREEERKLQLALAELEMQLDEQQRLVQWLENALDRTQLDTDRRLTQQQKEHERSMQLLLQQCRGADEYATSP